MPSARASAVLVAGAFVLLVVGWGGTRAPSDVRAPASSRSGWAPAHIRVGRTTVTSASRAVHDDEHEPHDTRGALEELDPALVDGHEAELRNQLAVTTPRPDRARNVGE